MRVSLHYFPVATSDRGIAVQGHYHPEKGSVQQFERSLTVIEWTTVHDRWCRSPLALRLAASWSSDVRRGRRAG